MAGIRLSLRPSTKICSVNLYLIELTITTRWGQWAVIWTARPSSNLKRLWYPPSHRCGEAQKTDRKLHGQDGYPIATELIHKPAQINFGELTKRRKRPKGMQWDKHRIFNVGDLGTTEVLLRSMAKTLREAVPPNYSG